MTVGGINPGYGHLWAAAHYHHAPCHHARHHHRVCEPPCPADRPRSFDEHLRESARYNDFDVTRFWLFLMNDNRAWRAALRHAPDAAALVHPPLASRAAADLAPVPTRHAIAARLADISPIGSASTPGLRAAFTPRGLTSGRIVDLLA